MNRRDSFPSVHMTCEQWLQSVYGYEPWEYDEHIPQLAIAYKKIIWS